MADVVREDLCRSVPFTVRDGGDTDGDGLTLDGYGAVFGASTRIDSWEGVFDEEIAPGAFRKSLRERTPRLQFDHGYHPLIGSIPIGRITEIGEDEVGLHVIARLSDNWLVEPVRDAIVDGAVDGMSFRFSVVREVWRDRKGKEVPPAEVADLLWQPGTRGPLRRTLTEVKVSEVGPVVWPAYDQTSVAVRGRVTIDLGRLDDKEQRKTLARAVLLADRAEADEAPGGTPRDSGAASHPETADGTPQATGTLPAGEHLPQRTDDPRRAARALWVRKARDTVLAIQQRST